MISYLDSDYYFSDRQMLKISVQSYNKLYSWYTLSHHYSHQGQLCRGDRAVEGRVRLYTHHLQLIATKLFVLTASTKSDTSNSESDSEDGFPGQSLSNKLVLEAKRTSRLSEAFPEEDDDLSDDDDENSAEAVVQRYMERVSQHITVLVVLFIYSTQLNKQMGYQEIKEFASLLRQYREDNMHVTEFCTKLQELYGEDRKFLLPGKRKS